MPTIKEYRSRLNAIRTSAVFQWRTPDEARHAITAIRLKQQELRALKNELQIEMRQVRADIANARNRVRPPAWTRAMRVATRAQAGIDEGARRAKAERLAPFEELTRDADAAIHMLAETKLQIERWMTAHKSANR